MEHFIKILTKADNLPIAGMLVAVIFLTWVAVAEARKNDRLIREGKKDQIGARMRE